MSKRVYSGNVAGRSVMSMERLADYIEKILAVAKIREGRIYDRFIDFTLEGITPGKASLYKQQIIYPFMGKRISLYMFDCLVGTVIQFSGISADDIDMNRLMQLMFSMEGK